MTLTHFDVGQWDLEGHSALDNGKRLSPIKISLSLSNRTPSVQSSAPFYASFSQLTQRFIERGNLREFDTLYGGERVKNTRAVRLGDLVVTHGDVTDH